MDIRFFLFSFSSSVVDSLSSPCVCLCVRLALLYLRLSLCVSDLLYVKLSVCLGLLCRNGWLSVWQHVWMPYDYLSQRFFCRFVILLLSFLVSNLFPVLLLLFCLHFSFLPAFFSSVFSILLCVFSFFLFLFLVSLFSSYQCCFSSFFRSSNMERKRKKDQKKQIKTGFDEREDRAEREKWKEGT